MRSFIYGGLFVLVIVLGGVVYMFSPPLLESSKEEERINIFLNAHDFKSVVAGLSDINTRNKKGLTPLHVAAAEGYANIIIPLIERGVDINARTKQGITPLHLAAIEGKTKVAELLISKGAKINAKDENLATPILYAIPHNWIDTVELLLNKGADVEVQAKNGFGLLHVAVAAGKPNMVQLLLDHKTPVNLKNNEGATPLDMALEVKNQDIINLLKKAGGKALKAEEVEKAERAKAEAKKRAVAAKAKAKLVKAIQTQLNLLYGTSLSVDGKLGRGTCAQIKKYRQERGLRQNCNATQSLLNHIRDYSDEKLVSDFLKEHGFSGINDTLKNSGRTPLMRALKRESNEEERKRNEYIARLLIAKGANVNAKSFSPKYGEFSDLWRPIHFAGRNGYEDIVRILIAKGANVNAKTRGGQTPLDWANFSEREEGESRKGIIQILRNAGGRCNEIC